MIALQVQASSPQRARCAELGRTCTPLHEQLLEVRLWSLCSRAVREGSPEILSEASWGCEGWVSKPWSEAWCIWRWGSELVSAPLRLQQEASRAGPPRTWPSVKLDLQLGDRSNIR